MKKEILFDDAGRQKLKTGVDAVANAVKVTLGPKGKNVILDRMYNIPQVTKDGVTVARQIYLADRSENMGALLMIEVASRTNDLAGDGTTTATILAQAIVTAGLKVASSGVNAMELKKGIDLATEVAVESIKNMALPVSDGPGEFTNLKSVASISANNDEAIGMLIAAAVDKVKLDGVVTIEDAPGVDDTIDIVNGTRLKFGYVSPHLMTNPARGEAVYDKPHILISDDEISRLDDILPILQKVAAAERSLLIIAKDINGEALAMMVVNKSHNRLHAVAVKSQFPVFHHEEMMEDIACLTGGVVISREKGLDLKDVELKDLGFARRVVVTKDDTTIIGCGGSPEIVTARVDDLKEILNGPAMLAAAHAQIIKTRIANLSGHVAVIRVGAASQVELKERKDRFEDALNATRAAIEEGIVPGGGIAYIRSIIDVSAIKGQNEERQMGVNIIKKALEAPLRQLAINSGLEPSEVLTRVREGVNSFGLNAKTGEYEPLEKAGVIDPVKVVRVALENASSIAGLILTTDCLVYIVNPEEDNVNQMSKTNL